MSSTPIPTMKNINFLSRSMRFLAFSVILSCRLIKLEFLSTKKIFLIKPEWHILDGDWFPVSLPLSSVVSWVVHVLHWDGVTGHTVPGQAPQHRLDRTLLRLQLLTLLVFFDLLCYGMVDEAHPLLVSDQRWSCTHSSLGVSCWCRVTPH